MTDILKPRSNNFMLQYDAAKRCFRHVAVHKGNLVNGTWPIKGDVLVSLQSVIGRILAQFVELDKCNYPQGDKIESEIFKEYGLKGYLFPDELRKFLKGIKVPPIETKVRYN